MTLDAVFSRARYLAIVLPLFALFSTIQGGCTSGTFYYGTYGAGTTYRTASGDDAPGGGSCVVYRSGESGNDGYFGPCVDDGYVYGGSSGSGP